MSASINSKCAFVSLYLFEATAFSLANYYGLQLGRFVRDTYSYRNSLGTEIALTIWMPVILPAIRLFSVGVTELIASGLRSNANNSLRLQKFIAACFISLALVASVASVLQAFAAAGFANKLHKSDCANENDDDATCASVNFHEFKERSSNWATGINLVLGGVWILGATSAALYSCCKCALKRCDLRPDPIGGAGPRDALLPKLGLGKGPAVVSLGHDV